MPDALAWRYVEDGEGSYWFNFRTNVTTKLQPAELTDLTAAEAIKQSKTFWRHHQTGVVHREHLARQSGMVSLPLWSKLALCFVNGDSYIPVGTAVLFL
jgi:hypothetical protein